MLELVREAARVLRDPRVRLIHEVLAGLPANAAVPLEEKAPHWEEGMLAVGLDLDMKG